jgi:methyl-accepting chemotaxis protein
LPSKSLSSAGKTALVVIGAGFGLLRSLKLLGNLTTHAGELRTLEARVDTLHIALSRLAGQTEELQARLENTISKQEIQQTLERVFGRVEEEVEARFEHQAKSVEALRTMVGQTDELLQRVLDGLESLKTESEELNGVER